MDLAKALTQFNPHTATPEALAAQVVVWAQEAQRLQEQADLVARQRQEIHLKDTKIKALTLELAYHKRIKFCSTSEAFTAQQRDLFNETQETDLNAMQAELEQLSSTPRVKAKPTGRKPLPAELPRVEQRHEPDSCACGACGHTLVKIGEDITEQLDVEPARFFVQRHIRPQYACRHCETITAAAIPAAIIDGGLATPSLHAWVVIQKYLDHLPLYRIEQISTRHGVTISRS
ncbi:transposase, partial [Undibacterium sp. GrIS 1.8]